VIQNLPDNASVTINRSRQIGNTDMLLSRVCQQYASGAVQISLMGTFEVRDISTIVDDDLFET
jgi:DNA-binding protein YbaB